MLASGIVKEVIADAMDNVCENNIEEITEFFQKVVDFPMCSDMCPCDETAFAEGTYDQLGTSILE